MRMAPGNKIIAHLLLCLVGNFCIAQQSSKGNFDNYRVVNWNVKQGLANGTAFSILKDKSGFLWIGTQDGLSRFDGYTFKNFLPNPNDTNSICGEFITGIKEDSLHNIWFGTNKGLSRYDIISDRFTNFLPVSSRNFSNTTIVPFWATKKEVICLESDSVITSFDIQTLTRRIITKLDHTVPDNYEIRNHNTIFEEATNTIWMLPDNDEGGLLEISGTNGNRVQHTWPCYRDLPKHDHYSEGMCYDKKRNSIWINSPDGLLQFTLNDKQFNAVDPLMDKHKRSPGIAIDNNDRIWVGTEREREVMFVYDPENKKVFFPITGDSTIQYFVNSTNSFIYCDRDDMVWIVYWAQAGKGINQLIPGSPSVTRYTRKGVDNSNALNTGFIYSLRDVADGDIWVSAENALYRLDHQTGSIHTIGKDELKGIQHNTHITFFGVDSTAKTAWFSNDESKDIFEMDIDTRRYKRLRIYDLSNQDIPRISIEEINPALSFQNGVIFCAGNGKNYGMYTISTEEPVVRQVLSTGTDRIRNYNLIGESLLILTLSEKKTHLCFRLEEGKWVHSSNQMENIQSDNLFYNEPDKSWWISQGKELARYDQSFKLAHTYTINEGIPKDGNIDMMNNDGNGNLWFKTHRLVSMLKIKTGKIITVTEKDGFESQPYYPGWPIVTSKNGDLYFFGGYDGMDRISPGKLIDKYPPAYVYLNSLEVNQKPFQLPTGINSLQELSLRHFQNKISLETGVIDFYAKGSSRIRYKLEGINDDWQYVPVNYVIHYEGLSPDKYTLVMQAANVVDDFNGPERRLVIIIHPPFWQTWWFRVLAAIAVIAIVYGYIQYRSRNLKKKNIALEKKVTVRTNELSKSLSDLKTTQDQLIHAEKMASLGELTSGIAHEIKNPLNFINNFSELNLDLMGEIKEEQLSKLDENTRAELVHIIKTMRKNSEKINHHGKRVDDIVKSMLQHSRVGNLTKEPLNVNALCEESLNLAYHGFKAKEKTFNASFETHFENDLPKIMAIPQDLSRVLLNLINNAFYAVHEKKNKARLVAHDASGAESSYTPKITVSTKKRDNKVVITVSDNGTGIPSQIINKIFQPFFTTKPTGEGTGLGLSMSYDIITKSHGGELLVKSKEGIGSEFEIILPV